MGSGENIVQGRRRVSKKCLTNRAYFFRGLKVSEEDLLTAMNVAEDPLVTEWSQPNSLQAAKAELEVLDQIDESERSARDKCELILDLLNRSRPLAEIRNAAIEKVE